MDFLNDLEKNYFRYTLISPNQNLNCEDDKFNQIELDLEKNDEIYKVYFEVREDVIYLYKIVCTTLKQKRKQSLIYEHMNLPYGLSLNWHTRLIDVVIIIFEHSYANLSDDDFLGDEKTLSQQEFQLSKESGSLAVKSLENLLTKYFNDYMI